MLGRHEIEVRACTCLTPQLTCMCGGALRRRGKRWMMSCMSPQLTCMCGGPPGISRRPSAHLQAVLHQRSGTQVRAPGPALTQTSSCLKFGTEVRASSSCPRPPPLTQSEGGKGGGSKADRVGGGRERWREGGREVAAAGAAARAIPQSQMLCFHMQRGAAARAIPHALLSFPESAQASPLSLIKAHVIKPGKPT